MAYDDYMGNDILLPVRKIRGLVTYPPASMYFCCDRCERVIVNPKDGSKPITFNLPKDWRHDVIAKTMQKIIQEARDD